MLASSCPDAGAATIRLEMPGHMQNSLIFHYNLKFYGDDKDNYEGVSLKRFVMQVGVGWGERNTLCWEDPNRTVKGS